MELHNPYGNASQLQSISHLQSINKQANTFIDSPTPTREDTRTHLVSSTWTGKRQFNADRLSQRREGADAPFQRAFNWYLHTTLDICILLPRVLDKGSSPSSWWWCLGKITAIRLHQLRRLERVLFNTSQIKGRRRSVARRLGQFTSLRYDWEQLLNCLISWLIFVIFITGALPEECRFKAIILLKEIHDDDCKCKSCGFWKYWAKRRRTWSTSVFDIKCDKCDNTQLQFGQPWCISARTIRRGSPNTQPVSWLAGNSAASDKPKPGWALPSL